MTQDDPHAPRTTRLSEVNQVEEVCSAPQKDGPHTEKRKRVDGGDSLVDELRARLPTGASPTSSSLARSDACQLDAPQAFAAAQTPVSDAPPPNKFSKQSRDKSTKSSLGTSRRIHLRNAHEVASLITESITEGSAYFRKNEKHQRSWRCDLERDKPESAKLSLLEAISRQCLYTERTSERNTISLFVEGWLLIALEGVRRDEHRKKLGTAGPKNDTARRTDTRKRKVGYAIAQLVKELSKQYGKRAYTVCTAIACKLQQRVADEEPG